MRTTALSCRIQRSLARQRAGVVNRGHFYSRSSIFAGNGTNDFSGEVISQGFNLIQNTNGCTITSDATGNHYGADPLLGPLQDNGGPTWTHALLPGSPCIDQGTSGGLTNDQRGVTRPYNVATIPDAAGGDGSDIGAYEWTAPPTVPYTCTTNNGTVTITGYTGCGGAVTIPSTINGLPVTCIGDKAFFACTSLTSVTIPEGVTSIGDEAFFACESLISVTIPDGVTSIGDEAFFACTGLVSVTLPNAVTNIGDRAFFACTSLTSVTIPEGVISIGDEAFFACESLTGVTIPRSVTNIGDSAFSFCSSLTGVHFKGNAPSLGSDVFENDNNATVDFLPGTTGWGSTFGGLPAVLWNPQVQTGGAGFGVLTDGFGFTITGSGNLVIVVEACTNLASPAWYPVGTNTLSGGSSHFSDPQWTNYPARFYRLRSP